MPNNIYEAWETKIVTRYEILHLAFQRLHEEKDPQRMKAIVADAIAELEKHPWGTDDDDTDVSDIQDFIIHMFGEGRPAVDDGVSRRKR